MEQVRIQKLLAEAGVASRRAIEEMIIAGRITVNGELVLRLPCFVDPDADDIRVDGKTVGGVAAGRQGPRTYFLLNKPRGVVCTQRDPLNRPRASDLVPNLGQRVYCVGGLDDDATGLVILTNDGELTRHLTDPRLGLEMSYVLEVDGRPDEDDIIRLKAGIFLDGKRTRRMRLKILHASPVRSTLEINTSEGRNHVLRRIFHTLGHKIRRIKRTEIGPIDDRGIKIGHFRPLLPGEVRRLSRVGKEPPAQRRPSTRE